MSLSFCGIAGRAKSGKDTLSTLLADLVYADQQRPLRSVAFATELKNELDPWCIKTYGFSAFTCVPEEKAIIRPFLVARGAGARAEDPDYCIKRVAPQAAAYLASGNFVTANDVRYPNELRWVHSLGGKVVYVKRIQPDGLEVPFANSEEAREDPLVEAQADIHLTWPTLPLDMLRPFVQDVWMQLTAPVSTP